jgi:hypothetical protein
VKSVKRIDQIMGRTPVKERIEEKKDLFSLIPIRGLDCRYNVSDCQLPFRLRAFTASRAPSFSMLGGFEK